MKKVLVKSSTMLESQFRYSRYFIYPSVPHWNPALYLNFIKTFFVNLSFPTRLGIPRLLLSVLACLCFSLSMHAAEQAGNEIAFLETGLGARPMGMGSAFTAMANDANAPYYNPAGMLLTNEWEFTTMQTTLPTDLSVFYMSGVKQNRDYAPGVATEDAVVRSAHGLYWVNGQISGLPEVDETDPDPNTDVKAEDYFNYQANALGYSYAKWVIPNVSVGFTATGFYKDFDKFSRGKGYGFTGSVGVLALLDYQWSVGFVVKDGINYQKWRTGTEEYVFPELRLGTSYAPFEPLILVLEARQKTDYRFSTTWHYGAEYSLLNFIRLRIGFDDDRTTTGVGLYTRHVSLDYAYTADITDGIGDAHRISLGVQL